MKGLKEKPFEKINYQYDSTFSGPGLAYTVNLFKKKYSEYQKQIETYNKSQEPSKEQSVFDIFYPIYFELSYYDNLTLLLSCTTVELWLNVFGVHLFDEMIYKKTIERRKAQEKIMLFVSIIDGIHLDFKHEEIKNVSVLFDKRNALVHPKPKLKYDPKDSTLSLDKYDLTEIKETIARFERVKKFLLKHKIITWFSADIGELNIE